MGVPRQELPSWDDLLFVTGQLAKLPQLDDVHVGTELVIGPQSKKPLKLDIPIFVSDMSFGALSEEAKVSLARGAELAGTGICSGEGGMLPEEQAENSRYFYELASGRFGFTMEKLDLVQAFHFKGGQGAKTGTGGHLPGNKVKGKIARVRGLEEGQPAVSPARFPDWESLDDYREFAAAVRKRTGGIPVGFKLSAQHLEEDLDAALEIGVDYVILDGRGGGTGAAPRIFRDHISVPTLPALARARQHLDRTSNSHVIGCIGMRACHTNNCPVGIATQQEHLRARLPVDEAAQRLARFLEAAAHLMKILARACGHTHLNQFGKDDLTSWKREVAELTGVKYAGVGYGTR
jgi:glutamate synthase domain-containing protein 2